ncbi:MAG: hypothetical protein DWQ37_09760 [Planctomycetota bacterium]|nr:MAG: hypothetical protein DWQ37_09760 [Planctomycetota bacterium]
MALALVSQSGCSRQFFRLRADKEVKYLITQKSNDPRWQYLNYTIGMDPRARYFDPTNPDCPPMPYDDPASHRYMHCIAGRKQWPCWHMNGDWYYLENPRWKDLLAQYNEVTEDGRIKLTMNGAVCLAQVHSPDYREQIEEIYLSALDVSTERFRFDVQFFGNTDTLFEHEGPLRNPAVGELNTLTQNSDLSASRQFSAGGELLVGLANSIVWQFAGPDTNFTTSLLDFSFIQPLLRNGGRAFVMERLTIVERALLANLRSMQFYRQGFYTFVTVGSGPGPGPNRQGGFTGGTGLTGFSGQGAGGFGTFGAGTFGIQGGGGGGGGGTQVGVGFAGGGAGQVGGFMGLLQSKQQIANLQLNLNSLLGTLGLLEANLDAGLIDIVQVDQFRQQIESTRANLLQAEIGFQNSLEGYKSQTIGLPPDTAIELDDSMLEEFQFLDPDTMTVQRMLEQFVRTVGDLPEDAAAANLLQAAKTLGELRVRLADQFASAHEDMERLQAAVPDREKEMTEAQRQTFAQERDRLADSLSDVENRFTDTEGALSSIDAAIQSGNATAALDQIVALGVGLGGLTQELALVKARARLETVTIPVVDVTYERALDIARANRLDWMNNRASLVDQWRLITFNANQLKAGLDLTFEGDINTTGNNPVNFNGRDGSLRVGVAFDAPFTRRLQRNNYRSALIFYQQQRRDMYQYQDGVKLSIRAILRQLAQLEVNMEIQRRAVVIAVRRVDKTREDLNKPPAPVEPGMPVESLGPTVGQNLIFALNDLTSAQNNLMSVVFNYYEARLLLYRTLGILDLDDCGMWIERPIDEAEHLTEDQCPLPPEVPQDWIEDADLDPREIEAAARRPMSGRGALQFADVLPQDDAAGVTDELSAGASSTVGREAMVRPLRARSAPATRSPALGNTGKGAPLLTVRRVQRTRSSRPADEAPLLPLPDPADAPQALPTRSAAERGDSAQAAESAPPRPVILRR